jgi:hypothetical protein
MEEAAKVEPRPDGTWRESLVGTYRAPGLGEMRIHLTDEGAVLEASQWEGLLGRKLEKDGSVKAVVMTPPLTGLEFSLGEQAGHKALLLDLPQQSYVFERDETPSVGPT